jgi:hypothetical protein
MQDLSNVLVYCMDHFVGPELMRDVPPTTSEGADEWPRGSIAPLPCEPSARHPQRIGSYVILGILGRGGMGVVYRAEQSHPKRTVALKVLPIGLLYSDRLVRRFDHEAEVLGRLQHPGIARIYEAGTADGGFGLQPFFAMELIDGEPLTQYASHRALSPRQRLELLARVCDAVHYAHQQGVIHRDLKPANLLVDGLGQPKVLDFGVARATETDTKWTLAETEAGMMLGTLPYMSPEQAAGNMEKMDTRSDVYALGVIAHELLTGQLPYHLAGMPLHDAVRVICDREPSRLGTIDRACRGDVETIVSKAMQKEKERRYDSAAELAADIRRYLNDEPIAARPPTTWYQLGKFARRNKTFVAAVFAVFLATVIGAGVAIWQKRQAELQLVKAGQLSDVLTDLFIPSGDGRADQAFLERLEKVSTPNEPLPQANVCRVIAMGWDDLERPEKSVPYWRRALDLRQRHLGEDKPATVDAAIGLATALLALKCPEEAEHPILRASYCARRALGAEDPSTLSADLSLATVWCGLGRADEADRLFAKVIAAQEHNRGTDDVTMATTLSEVGIALLQDESAEAASKAERHLREAMTRFESAIGLDASATIVVKRNLVVALCRLRRFAEAEPFAMEVQRRLSATCREGDPELLQATDALDYCRQEMRKSEEVGRGTGAATRTRPTSRPADH